MIKQPSPFYFCDHVLDRLKEQKEKQKIGEYFPFIFHKLIEEGAYGSVYECTLDCFDFKMAAKVIPKAKTELYYLCQEVAISRFLHHPNIVNMYDVITFENDYLLLMEFVQGKDLFTWLLKQTAFYENIKLFPVECFRERMFILKEIVSVISYIWENGIVHRDLKLENILYCDITKRIKICDFGLATYLSEKKQIMRQACGSIRYVSPEVLNEAYTGESSTVWSLGVITYLLMVNSHPFQGENSREIFDAIQNANYNIPNLAHIYEMDPSDAENQTRLLNNLLKSTFSLQVDKRITLHDLVNHPFFNMSNPPLIPPIISEQKKKRFDLDPTLTTNTVLTKKEQSFMSILCSKSFKQDKYFISLIEKNLLATTYSLLESTFFMPFDESVELKKLSLLTNVQGSQEWKIYQTIFKNYLANKKLLQNVISAKLLECKHCELLQEWNPTDTIKIQVEEPFLLLEEEPNCSCVSSCLIM